MDRAQRVGANIKHFRELAGLTKSELARRVKVSPTAVNNWEENGVIPLTCSPDCYQSEVESRSFMMGV